MKTGDGHARALAVVGNLTLDEVNSNGRHKVTPGGSALYVSATAAFLGSIVGIQSQVGPDYPQKALSWLKHKGVDVAGVSRVRAPTTRFSLSYRTGSRRLRIVQPGIRLPRASVEGSWKALHLGPVFDEVPLAVIPTARKHSTFLSMDMQGFLRRKTGGGKVQLRAARLDPFFHFFDLVKVTTEEARVQTSAPDVFSAAKRILHHGPRRLLATIGGRGALLAEKGKEMLRIPAYPEPAPVDPTGAGDALVGGWIATFLITGDPVWAASVGSAIASLLIRRVGPAKFRIRREELFRRSAWIYNRVGPVEG